MLLALAGVLAGIFDQGASLRELEGGGCHHRTRLLATLATPVYAGAVVRSTVATLSQHSRNIQLQCHPVRSVVSGRRRQTKPLMRAHTLQLPASSQPRQS
jgi:hypothetical protein